MAALRVGSIVIRVDDLARQKAFWSAALDYVPRERDDDDFALLRPRDGDGPNVSLDRHRAETPVPPRIHLDLYAEDQAAEVERLKGLGATEVQWERRPADADYVILADPEGNRFCVVAAGGHGGVRPAQAQAWRSPPASPARTATDSLARRDMP
jgi:catechol 2,3-dioxygenase-like lactoylglutathione lyase family enzyme